MGSAAGRKILAPPYYSQRGVCVASERFFYSYRHWDYQKVDPGSVLLLPLSELCPLPRAFVRSMGNGRVTIIGCQTDYDGNIPLRHYCLSGNKVFHNAQRGCCRNAITAR